VAVPIEHARRNLARVIEATTDNGGRVLLASEGLAPDPGPLDPYNAMMAALADAEERVSYLDLAGQLHRSDGQVFLDDCHLTELGHDIVASTLATQVRALTGLP
jgi:hypothetical protein